MAQKASERASEENLVDSSHESEDEREAERLQLSRNKRKQLKSKITRTMNRIRDTIKDENPNKKRIRRELDEVKEDFKAACEMNWVMFDKANRDEKSRLDEWEKILTYEVYDIEEEVEDYFASLRLQEDDVSLERVPVRNKRHTPPPIPVAVDREQQQPQSPISESDPSQVNEQSVNEEQLQQPVRLQQNPPPLPGDRTQGQAVQHTPPQQQPQRGQPTLQSVGTGAQSTRNQPVDAWIDELQEFSETVIPCNDNMTMLDALYKLQATKDIPNVTIDKFSGDPLHYVEFIERFKLYIHDKPHLTNDMRMVQLKMHVTGEAERAISGLGASGIMYVTALKTLKYEFGQASVIARACVNKLIKGSKISDNDRQGLRELSVDIINCVATLKQINNFADVNANENLRKIVRRLPDRLIDRWKGIATDLRDKGIIPGIQNISDFIRKHVKAAYDPDFGDIDQSNAGKYVRNQGVHNKYRKGVHSTQNQFKVIKCYICEENHRVAQCPTFADSTAEERNDLVKKSRLCFSCLNRGHVTRDCRSKKPCGKDGCTKLHHALLHIDPPVVSTASPLDTGSIMPVIRVRFHSANGRSREGNVLIDSGAGTTIIRKDFAKSLGLQGPKETLDISVVGGETLKQRNSRRLKFSISPLEGGEEFPVEAHEIEKTVISIPALDRSWLHKFNHLRDIRLTHKAGPVDLILGVQYSHLHVEEETRQGLPFEPVGKRTKLGWLVIGPDNSKTFSPILSINFVKKIDFEKFYEFETLGIQANECSCPKPLISRENKKVLNLFESSCKKRDGRYEIGLPWKRSPEQLPDNYLLAEKRLISLERSLLKSPVKAEMYKTAFAEYEKNGWSRILTPEELKSDRKAVYYLPHHGVYRPEKVSTPLRIVFDPACMYEGVSLNSFLYKGPCLIGNLLGVLLRFREEEVGFTGDISKMYLQIYLPESDTHVHRVLWRDLNVAESPKIYRLLRVTFGDKPSPDMASFVMLHMAKENEAEYPDAAIILQRDRYMDDLIHSCASPHEAAERMKQLDQVLSTGSFKIKEWYCSSAELKEHAHVSSTNVDLDCQGEIKTLGIGWNPESDVLHFSVKEIEMVRFTKRTVLSRISMLYDPLGLASVVTIRARIAMQDLWRSKKYNWDDPLPEELCSLWRDLFRDIAELKKVVFPRCLKPSNSIGEPELHVFSDASGVAYGAAAYLLWNSSDGPHVQLVLAKARVAPLKQTTIPRLELMGALLAARLARTVVEDFKRKPVEVTLWTDSKVVLHWIRSESTTFKAFVGIRVSEIQTTWDPSLWRHVPSKLNPADDLTRGLTVDEMHGRWMHGPSYLKLPKSQWPSEIIGAPKEDSERKNEKFIFAVTNMEPVIQPQKYSNWNRLVRVTAYCLRFIHNLREGIKKSKDSIRGQLQPEELDKAEKYWIKTSQSSIENMEGQYKDLSPFMQDGVIRVGGRLRHSQLTYDQIHPILLPTNHVSKLIMRQEHENIGHAGAERTLSSSRRRYWIVRGRNMAKGIVRECIICRKLRQPPYTTLMADLPAERLKPYSPPFSVTGVDLFGPFLLKYGRNKTVKAWGALFTCATMRAIHLEIVQDLSTPAFLHALRRFVTHHGWPQMFISDNGTNFVGAQKELKKLVQEGREQIEDFAMLHKVKWKFNTPLSPHQGGLFESLIKQAKGAIRIAIGQQSLTWNEMSTVFAEVKCLINSRPIGFASNDPNDLQPLTPNHFLLGRATAEIPQGPFEETKNRLKRFEFTQMLVNHFWNRFVKEYMPTLMKRSKWQHKGKQLQVGDIVLVIESGTPRGKWNLSRIVEVYPGSDGVVRNVKVKNQHGEYKRSVQKCCLILEDEM